MDAAFSAPRAPKVWVQLFDSGTDLGFRLLRNSMQDQENVGSAGPASRLIHSSRHGRRQGILTGEECQDILTGMDEKTRSEKLSPEGLAKIEAVDIYLGETIRDGRPIETLIATRRLGEIMNDRAKEAARVATAESWSWTDVGRALGITRQAAHEKLRARVRDEIDKGRAKLERAEKAGRAKIARRAMRGRERLDKVPPLSPKVESARQRIDEWEHGQHETLTRQVERAREDLDRAEQSVRERLDRKG
jgi:hypothetical protein